MWSRTLKDKDIGKELLGNRGSWRNPLRQAAGCFSFSGFLFCFRVLTAPQGTLAAERQYKKDSKKSAKNLRNHIKAVSLHRDLKRWRLLNVNRCRHIMKSILTTRVSVSIENGSFQRFGRECYRIYVDLKSILTMMLLYWNGWNPDCDDALHTVPTALWRSEEIQ